MFLSVNVNGAEDEPMWAENGCGTPAFVGGDIDSVGGVTPVPENEPTDTDPA